MQADLVDVSAVFGLLLPSLEGLSRVASRDGDDPRTEASRVTGRAQGGEGRGAQRSPGALMREGEHQIRMSQGLAHAGSLAGPRRPLAQSASAFTRMMAPLQRYEG